MNNDHFYAASKRIVLTAVLATGLSAGMSYAAPSEEVNATPHSDNAMAAISDTGITAQIKAKFMQEKRLDGSDISITTTNGVVTLDGSVRDARAKALAQARAQTIKGVKSVDNNLTVPTNNTAMAKSQEAAGGAGQVISDSWITTKVKSAILEDNASRGLDINVKTENGVVILSGARANQEVIDHVKRLAFKIKGVKSVNTAGLSTNQLQ